MRNQLLPCFAVCLVVCLAGCASRDASEGVGGAAEVRAARPIETVDAARAHELITEDESVVVLDIRTPGEFSRGRIAGAQLVDFMADDFADRLRELDKGGTYVMYRASGGRSSRSLPLFEELGFRRVLHLEVGYRGWVDAGQPVEK